MTTKDELFNQLVKDIGVDLDTSAVRHKDMVEGVDMAEIHAMQMTALIAVICARYIDLGIPYEKYLEAMKNCGTSFYEQMQADEEITSLLEEFVEGRGE